ncbi:MAG TPA: hydroxyacid dehydrogenase, partial [Tepidisphaeraceae bacterium]|nr:hydroxyacid dehydrogenase [Tepidisphaeraceae bacterium]
MVRARILVVPPVPLYRKLFSVSADQKLRALGPIRFNESDIDWSADELCQRIGEADVLVTSWRTPRLTDDILDRAPRLKLVAHSAGSVKFMLDESLMARGIAVSTAGAAMVQPVAETTVLLCMLMLRPLHELHAGLRAGRAWTDMKLAGVGEELTAQTVGVVGAGQIGRRVIRMLRAWDVDVRVYDPCLTPEDAAALEVTAYRSLDEMLPRCRIISLHAPILPQTRHMIGPAQLDRLADGTILINTARAWLVDTTALADHLRTGRLRYATDVYDNEPLPID